LIYRWPGPELLSDVTLPKPDLQIYKLYSIIKKKLATPLNKILSIYLHELITEPGAFAGGAPPGAAPGGLYGPT